MTRVILCLVLASTSTVFAQVPSVINVEIDWMANGLHSHRPNQDEIGAAVQVFACHGITLNVVVDDSIPDQPVLLRDPNDSLNFFGYNNGMLNSFARLKTLYFNNNGGGWHYCIFAHQFQDESYATVSNSGLGERPGDDFIVTLGEWADDIGTPWQRASTFAHELGHNLGLSHSGSMNVDVVGPYAPALPSVMSYFYQLAGVKANLECRGLVTPLAHLFKNLDYSNGIGCIISEFALNELTGMGMSKVDWNCDGLFSGTTSRDLSNSKTANGWCASSGSLQILSDYNEWANIADVTSATLSTAVERKSVMESCISYEEYVAYSAALGGCPEPPVTNEPCVSGRMRYVRVGGTGTSTGPCTAAYGSIAIAHTLSTSGDVVFISPGNYPENILLNKHITLAGPGGVVIGTP